MYRVVPMLIGLEARIEATNNRQSCYIEGRQRLLLELVKQDLKTCMNSCHPPDTNYCTLICECLELLTQLGSHSLFVGYYLELLFLSYLQGNRGQV